LQDRIPHLKRIEAAMIADNATVTGDVTLQRDVSVWYGTVIRGDVASITIGERTNVQDLVMIHPQHDEDVTLGSEITIGHGAVVHGRIIEDRCLIGIKAILLPGSIIGEGSIIGAGALVPVGRIIPPRSLVVGTPGRVVRQVSDEEYAAILDSAERYVGYATDALS
jgi:carbonic anhydrase/acetyltransferase-like protein (isoleucine patch superfamily)